MIFVGIAGVVGAPFALAADGLLDLQPRLLEFHAFCLILFVYSVSTRV
jgi:hypothetical protein